MEKQNASTYKVLFDHIVTLLKPDSSWLFIFVTMSCVAGSDWTQMQDSETEY